MEYELLFNISWFLSPLLSLIIIVWLLKNKKAKISIGLILATIFIILLGYISTFMIWMFILITIDEWWYKVATLFIGKKVFNKMGKKINF